MAEEVTSLESTEKMTFFESFYRSAMEDLETDGQRLEFYDKLMAYAFDGVAPESDDRMVRMALRMAMPNVRRSAGKRRAGSRGGRGNRAAGGQEPAEPRPAPAPAPEPEPEPEPEPDPERIRAAMIAAGAVWGGRPARESSAKSTSESTAASDMDRDWEEEVDGDLESSSQSCCFPSPPDPPAAARACPHCHSRMEPTADGTALVCGLCGRQVSWADALMAMDADRDGPLLPGRGEAA